MEKAITVIGGLVVLILNLFLAMFTVSTLWGWFIVPLGAPVISLVQAYGLILILAYFKARHSTNFVKGVLEHLTFGQKVGKAVGINLIVLLVGWIATLFM